VPIVVPFFVYHATNFAPCAARNGPQTTLNAQHASFVVHFSMSAALKSVVDVQCAMKYEQCFMF
jgi:hypothetical protein